MREKASATEPVYNIKKLMKIIYEKEKEVDKYRKQVKCKQKMKEKDHDVLSVEQQHSIKEQAYETQKFLTYAATRINEMQAKIFQLKNELEYEASKNIQLEEQIIELEVDQKKKSGIIEELKKQNQKIEKAHSEIELENKQFRKQREQFKKANESMRKLYISAETENKKLTAKIEESDKQISKAIRQISKNMRKLYFSQKIVSFPSEFSLKIQSEAFLHQDKKSIHSGNHLARSRHAINQIDDPSQSKLMKLIKWFKAWEEALLKTEEDIKHRYEAQLCEHSILGFSKLINESQIFEHKKEEESFVPSPSFIKNEEELLLKLEEECARSDPIEIEKEKLIQLSQVKESLKMTKQINAQLFQEINQKQAELKNLRQKLKVLQPTNNKENKL